MTTNAKPAAFPLPRPSATVVLLRDTPGGPEVLLGRRPEQAAFGSSYVFPGGVCDGSDLDLDEPAAATAGDAALCRRLGVAAGGLGLFSAAIRELFEETGVLLARRPDDSWPGSLEERRRQLNSAALRWATLLADESLRLDCAALAYFAYRVTPRARPRRWATWFFMARLPDGQLPQPDGVELTDCRWLRPTLALGAAAAGELKLPAPTRVTLERLTRFDSAAAACAWARRREAAGVACTLPAIVRQDGRRRILLPGDPDYPADRAGAEA